VTNEELVEHKLTQLQKASKRLTRFCRALIQMGAVETPQALEVEIAEFEKLRNWTETGK
jgi:hypothetical protein